MSINYELRITNYVSAAGRSPLRISIIFPAIAAATTEKSLQISLLARP